MKYWIAVLLLVSFVSAGCDSGQIDINSASIKELDKLDGVGPVKAQAIVDERDFDSVEDLIDVDGIGEKTLKKILNQNLACVEGAKDEKDEEEKKVEEKVVEKNFVEEEVLEKNIVLGEEDDVFEEEVVYISRDRKVMEFLPYVFCFVLIFVIVILVWQRF